MIVQHITALSQDSQDRDTSTILPVTERHFRPFSRLGLGQHSLVIEKTPFTCRVTLAPEGAIFDLFLQDTDSLLFMNVCCFSPENKAALMGMVTSFCAQLPTLSKSSLVQPTHDAWLYTLPIAPFLASPAQLMTAGETEFYIWNALRKAMEKSS